MGRPAYVWISNAYVNTGRDVASVSCDGLVIPPFNNNALFDAPQTCFDGSGLSEPRSQVNYFDASFKFPQQLKASLAIDQRLPGGVIGTIEFLYTRHVNTIYQQEMNISAEALATNAEGRQLFGDPANFSSRGIAPTRIDPAFVHILRHTNENQDRAYALTFQLQKRFSRGYEFNAGYTYQNVRDLTSLGSSRASSNYGFSPVSGGSNPNQKRLTTSFFDVPHRITFSGTIDIPIENVPTSITLLYVGQSGSPYTWTINGDANGDGYEGAEVGSRHNDVVFVPNAAGTNFTPDGSDDLAAYQALIGNDLIPDLMPCLREQQQRGGGIPERNTCRNPWRNRLDASVRIGVGRLVGGNFHRLTLVGDIFNLPNMIDGDWGVVRGTSFFETRTALELEGYDTVNDRGVYAYTGPNVLGPLRDFQSGALNPETGQPYTAPEARRLIERNVFSASDINSRWRLQIGVRYDF
jgi:hypothetical protein